MSDVHNLFLKCTDPPLLVQTKLNPPPISQNLVLRQRLLDKLDMGLAHRLTLVTAPAGFGKSTLATHWASRSKAPVAWLSLEQEDNDAVVFWSYFIQSLKSIHPQLGKQAQGFLSTSSSSQWKNILTVLINETNRFKEDFVIILDDFHSINDPVIYSSLSYLLTHLPSRFHIFIISRAIPDLPLASLRAKGQLLEIPTNDLRFTVDEEKIFFDLALQQFSLTRSELLVLDQQIEGWAVGLQLASIIINNSPQKSTFIRNVAEDQRHFADYFYQEILVRQPEMVKDFLLKTSLLQKMNAPLCDALTDSDNSQELLEYLEQMNLFITPLDNYRCWYRYHHYFARILKAFLQQKEPESIPRLHQKASLWLKNNGFYSEAIYHALEGKDFEEAATLIETEASNIFLAGELATLSHWIHSLPNEIRYKTPIIWLYQIWILILSGKFSKAEASCLELQGFLDSSEVDFLAEKPAPLEFIKSEVKIIDGYLAVLLEKPGATEIFLEAIKAMKPGSLRQMITLNPGSASLLQLSSVKGGKLRKAANFYQATEPIIKETSNLPSFAFGYTILGEIYYEVNDWRKAQTYLQTAINLGGEKIDLGVLIPTYITLAKIKNGLGKPYAAQALLDILEKKIQDRKSSHWSSIIEAYKARMAMAKNDQTMVHRWLNHCQLSANDEITILQHYLFTTLARGFLYLGQREKTLKLTERIAIILQEEGGVGQRIENSILQAICYQKLNQADRSLESLKHAVQMGLEEGYYRIFIDEGELLFDLIKALMTQQTLIPSTESDEPLKKYTKQLYQGFIKENYTYLSNGPASSMEEVKSLTIREWEVLRLLAQGFSNQAIAEKLFISTVTAKTHVQNICRKLNVKSRAKAIARINELNLLSIDHLSND